MNTIERIINWARLKSPWIIHFNSGACNACDIEVLAALTPRYDVERFGVQLKGSPRHADVLVCSGPVTMQQRDRLVTIYQQMPEPKFVIAVGTCACSAGVFDGCYCVEGGIDTAVPVNMYVPGCPVKPEAIIDGVVKLLKTLEDKETKPKKGKKGKAALEIRPDVEAEGQGGEPASAVESPDAPKSESEAGQA